MGSLEQQFIEYIRPSEDLPVSHSPHDVSPPLKFLECIPGLEIKSEVPRSVFCQLAEERLAMKFYDHIHAFKGGSVNPVFD